MSAMFDRGYAHFLQGINAPDQLVQRYPTRDKHTAAEEAEFVAGFNAAQVDLENQQLAAHAHGD